MNGSSGDKQDACMSFQSSKHINVNIWVFQEQYDAEGAQYIGHILIRSDG